MNYTENYEGIKLDVQAVDIQITDGVQQGIRDVIDKIKHHAHKINFVDVYLKVEDHAIDKKSVRMRIGVPGPDVFAEDKGDNWAPMFKSVTDKLSRQLEKLYKN